ncbi:MAG: hypothetical protein J6Y20_04520 [Lachnospiraceae bacterium]|nr:hypothetical protein [Kiritimatiellia bacterium]MBP5461369.1 hypothetical protein [Lachnospiraceae bacterium]
MKARNKVTGEVVSNFGWSKEYGTISYIGADGLLHNYSGLATDWKILDESETDWDAYRREAAKDILCTLLREGIGIGYNMAESTAGLAVKYTDALIAKLKEK